jgi:hypothetical protein
VSHHMRAGYEQPVRHGMIGREDEAPTPFLPSMVGGWKEERHFLLALTSTWARDGAAAAGAGEREKETG